MTLSGKKLGMLLSAKPTDPGFLHGLRTAGAALDLGVDVYLYCIDDAVPGIDDPRLQDLKERGLKLYACAYGAHKRHYPLNDKATFAGLTVVSDLISGTDRFLSFN